MKYQSYTSPFIFASLFPDEGPLRRQLFDYFLRIPEGRTRFLKDIHHLGTSYGCVDYELIIKRNVIGTLRVLMISLRPY